jgi:hypothetical protein
MDREVVDVHRAVRCGGHPDQSGDHRPQTHPGRRNAMRASNREDCHDTDGNEALLNGRLACPQ